MLASINPVNGEVLERFEYHSMDQIDRMIGESWRSFQVHRTLSFAERAAWLTRAADLLEQEKNRWARVMTLEMGKPIGAAVAEAEKCARVCRYYAENGAAFLAEEEIATNAARSTVRYDPLGPVLAIMPWNFPFWQVLRFAAPALMAGNSVLLKHASSVPQCALAIEEIFHRAGVPAGSFQAVFVETDDVEHIIADPRVRAVTLTGSVGAGRSVGSLAGANIKTSVLELGGSDPFIVMPSANIEQAARTAVDSRVINNGQSCIAAKRFIVHDRVYDEFAERMVDRMKRLKIGDPLDENTEIGPLAAEDLRSGLEQQVAESVAAGAKVLTGGNRVERAGFFYEPTVLADIPESAPAYRDELFGPVASLFRVANIDEAIALANDTEFGLGSSVWTSDPAEIERFARDLDAGQVFVNAMVASDPRVPFGGVKNSGYGRELGPHGIREFVNVKTVWIESPETSSAANRNASQPVE